MAQKYKVGDKVRIKSIDWYNKNKNKNKDEYGTEVKCEYFSFSRNMIIYCGQIMTISIVRGCSYSMIEDDYKYAWTDEMIEGLVEDETKPEPKFKVGDKVILDPYPCKITDVHWRDSLHGFVYTVRGTDFGKTVKEADLVFDERTVPNTNEIIRLIKNDWNNFKDRYDIPDDYHFVDKNGNEVNISDIVLEKKKTKYPKTYAECCKVFGLNHYLGLSWNSYDEYSGVITGLPKRIDDIAKKLESLSKLLICRDAYWKIAGEEMGLGKAWEPDWNNISNKYCIYFVSGDAWSKECQTRQCPLSFPTPEMRDAFYENFKEEIEICKELL